MLVGYDQDPLRRKWEHRRAGVRDDYAATLYRIYSSKFFASIYSTPFLRTAQSNSSETDIQIKYYWLNQIIPCFIWQCFLASTAEKYQDEDFVHLGVLKMILMEQLKVIPNRKNPDA